MISLRPYQETAIADIRTALSKHRRVLFTMPTGSGKGTLVAFMMKQAAERGLRCWLTCHRTELLDQLSASLWELDVPHGVIASGRSPTAALIQVASVQTLVRRLDKLRPPSLLAVDEAHHAPAATFRKIMEHCKNAWTVGLTATPVRTSGEGLTDLFDTLVQGPTTAELIAQGYLAKYRVIGSASAPDTSAMHKRAGDYVTGELEGAVDRKGVTGDAVANYKKYVAPHSCLVFCVSRKHAHHVEEAYRAAGINALYVGGDTPDAERRQAVKDFKDGKLPVITSVEIFSEGVDSPNLRAVQTLRPTASLGLHLQQLGRGLRIEPGKSECVILDHAGNVGRVQPDGSFVVKHGLPDDEREWTLEGRPKRAATESAPNLRCCKNCFAIYSAFKTTCPACGTVPEVRLRLPTEIEGELTELDLAAIRTARKQEEGKARTLEDLVKLAAARGYKPMWVAYRWAARTGSPVHQVLAQVRRMATNR